MIGQWFKQDIEAVVAYEKNRLARAYQQKMAEEEDKRQLKLFDEPDKLQISE